MFETPEAVMAFLDRNIEYGWVDVHGERHIREMKDFRPLYRTMPLEECLREGLGTCIEQTYLIFTLLRKGGIPAKMFCSRLYESGDRAQRPEEDEHMHCFALCCFNGKICHLEHTFSGKRGIHRYDTEREAIETAESWCREIRDGKSGPTTEFFTVEPGLTFQRFNGEINRLDLNRE